MEEEEGLEACTVVEQVDMVLEEEVMVELLGAMVPPAVVVPAVVATLAHVESLLERSAPLVVWVAAVEDPARVPCHTWEPARESTCKRRPTNTSGLEAILIMFDHEEISPASSQAAVC